MKPGGAPPDSDQGTERWTPPEPEAEPGATTAPSGGGGLGRVETSHYDFDDVVGRGGAGVVIKARDRRLRRQVAIKLIPGRDAPMQARFEREALLTARLQHPGIVPIYEAGRWPNGESFYAMRLIEGQPLSELIAACTSLDERLALLPKVVGVTEAVAYAHTQRVIHRDLKPRNVVVGAFGEVMVVDWGLAKDLIAPDAPSPDDDDAAADAATSGADHTVLGTVMGTPAYMPPEQASGEAVDERADVYALGALLYHLLTGAPPFTGTVSSDVLRQAIESQPAPVEQLQPGVPRDLAAIVGKAMARAPADRYANAGELAADIKRFVTGQLVGAHHYSRRVLIARAIRRHPVSTVAAAFAVVAVVLGAFALRRIVAEKAATESRSRELLLGQARALVETDPTAAVALLERYPDRPGERERARAVALDAESRGVARHVLVGHTADIHDLAMSPDGAEVASTAADGSLVLWNVTTGAREELYRNGSMLDVVEFDPSGKHLAASNGPKLGVVVWDRATRTTRVLATDDDIYAIAFSPDGALLAGGSAGGNIYIWTVATGERRDLAGHEAWIASLEFSPDGTLLLSASQDGTARLWTVATGEARAIALADQGYEATFAPDGTAFAVGDVDGAVQVFATAAPAAPVRELRGDHGAVDCLEFSPDGRELAWAGMGEAVYVAELATGQVRALHGHQDDVTVMRYLADGSLITASADGTLRHWDVATGLAAVLRGHTDQVTAMAVSPDGRVLASGSVDRTVRVWELAPAPRSFVIKASRESDFRAPPTNDVLYFYQDGHVATALDLRTGAARTITTARPWARMVGNAAGTQVAYRDGQRHIALVDLGAGPEQEHDVSTGVELVGRVMEYSPDGATLVVPGRAGLSVIDTATRVAHELPYRSGPIGPDDPKIVHLQFATDSQRVVTAGVDLMMWNLATAESHPLALPPLAWPSDVVASPDLSTIAATEGGRVAVFDGTGWRRLIAVTGEVFPMAFSRDGARLATADDRGTLRLWQLAGAGAPVELIGHTGPVRRIEFSADGRRLVTAGTDGSVRTWDVATGQQLVAIRAHGGRAVEFAGFRGAELVSAGRDGAVRVWPPVTREPGPLAPLLTGLTRYRGPD